MGSDRVLRGDRTTKWSGIVSVGGVVGVCGWLSYWHIVDVVSVSGEAGVSGHLFPVVIDGTLLASSAVLTGHARRRVRAPIWAWVAAGMGVAETFAFNIAYGAHVGAMAAFIASLVALTLLVNIELLMLLLHGPKSAVPDTTADTAPADTFRLWTPDTKAPDIRTPQAEAPDTRTPDTRTPDTKAPDTKVPDTKVPDTKVPDTKAPDIRTEWVVPPARTPDRRTQQARVAVPAYISQEAVDIFSENPDISGEELARKLDMDPRTARRWRRKLREAAVPVTGPEEPARELVPA